MLRVTIQLSPPGVSDVGSREFFARVNGTDQPVQTLTGDPLPLEAKFDCEANASCEVWLVDIDKSNNRSPESEHLTFTALDTFPPPAPGVLAVSNVEQLP